MSPADRAPLISASRAGLAAATIAAMLIALLPATALAAGPVAADDHVSVPVNAAATTIDVRANDTGVGLTIESVIQPTHGTVVVAGDALSVTYEPDSEFHGTDTFDYTVTDGSATDTGAVTVDVNSPPVAVDDPGTACQPSSTDLGDAFPIPEDFINHVLPPTGAPAGYFLLWQNCALLHNDTDLDHDPLTWDIVTQPAHGTVLKVDEEFFAYRPDPDYSATDHGFPATDFETFTYKASDGYADSAPATMRFWVAPVNDAPTFSPGPATVVVGEDSGPYSDAWATNVSPGPASESWQTVHFEVEADLDGWPGLFSVPPAMDATGHLTFTPAPDQFGGLVHVTVRAKDDGGLEDWGQSSNEIPPRDTSADATFDIVVMPDGVTAVDDEATLAEDPDPGPWLIDVLGNDTVPDGAAITEVTQDTLGTVTIAPDGLSVLYQPDENANGEDTFTYTLDDGESADVATVHVTITPVNDDPVAGDDSVIVRTDGPAKAVDVLDNDQDVDGDTLHVTGTSTSSKGTVTITGGGTGVTYQPGAGKTGTDSFTYTVSDGNGGFDLGSVDVTIADDIPPTAGDDSLTILEDADPTAIDVLLDDSDDDGDPLHIIATSTPAKGMVVITGGGTGLTYTPTPNANGADSFTYTISDGHGGTDTATVSVTITPQQDAPKAVTDTLTVAEDVKVPAAVPVLANDTDADHDALTVTLKTNGTKGVVAISPGGTGVTYLPNANANGSDSFTYTVSDGHGGTDIGTVNVTITPVNDLPVASNDTAFTVAQGSGATALAVLSNDSDVDGDALQITARANGAHGSVSITGGGTGLTYDPTGLYVGTDVFTYTVSDGHGGTDTATVLLTVVKDTLKPAATAPIQAFVNGTAGTTTATVHLTWSGTDTGGTGIGTYKVQVSKNGGSFKTVTSSTTGTSWTGTVSVNATYRYRVRATDKGGNVGSYVNGSAFKVVRYQNTSGAVHYAGSWKTKSTTKALGKSHRYTGTAGAAVTYTGQMRNVAWIATKSTAGGTAQVWIDGSLAATINLHASSTGYRKVVFHRDFGTLATHTIEIRSLGGGRTYLDALAILR